MAINIEELDLPEEISVKDAAMMLSVDKKTVLGYIRESVLPARDASLPSSMRPMWRMKLAAVLELRGDYQRQEATENESPAPRYKLAPRYEPTILKRKPRE